MWLSGPGSIPSSLYMGKAAACLPPWLLGGTGRRIRGIFSYIVTSRPARTVKDPFLNQTKQSKPIKKKVSGKTVNDLNTSGPLQVSAELVKASKATKGIHNCFLYDFLESY